MHSVYNDRSLSRDTIIELAQLNKPKKEKAQAAKSKRLSLLKDFSRYKIVKGFSHTYHCSLESVPGELRG